MSARIRTLEAGSRAAATEIDLVARRMRATLVEVLGEEEGGGMYTHGWLVARVGFHLDPEKCTGAVFLAEGEDGHVAGHAIVRLDDDGFGHPIGLFSTLYVEPASRRLGLARALIARGEEWMRAHGQRLAVTYTHEHNAKLHRLFGSLGYALAPMPRAFVKLSRPLDP